MALRHPYPIYCGPFSAISVTLHSDSRPIHLGVKLRTSLSGVVSCYGIIASKIRGWNTYEVDISIDRFPSQTWCLLALRNFSTSTTVRLSLSKLGRMERFLGEIGLTCEN
jgi:hypothetical protein